MKKVTKHYIKTAIVVDYAGTSGSTQKQEIKDHKERFGEFAEPAKLKVYTPSGTYPGQLEPGTDLVIYDFGGLMPGNTLMESNARHLAQWAADNPNALVVIVSDFTYKRYFQYEAEELGLTELHNITVDCSFEKKPPFRGDRYSPLPEWFEKAHGIESKE